MRCEYRVCCLWRSNTGLAHALAPVLFFHQNSIVVFFRFAMLLSPVPDSLACTAMAVIGYFAVRPRLAFLSLQGSDFAHGAGV